MIPYADSVLQLNTQKTPFLRQYAETEFSNEEFIQRREKPASTYRSF
jgi:hypothetical protein